MRCRIDRDTLSPHERRDLVSECIVLELEALAHALRCEAALHPLLPETQYHLARLATLVAQWKAIEGDTP
jgi:hypothetical protein